LTGRIWHHVRPGLGATSIQSAALPAAPPPSFPVICWTIEMNPSSSLAQATFVTNEPSALPVVLRNG
jgi:hypothetical protein